MKSWFTGLTQREQLSVFLMGLAVFLYLLYMLVWSPLNARRDSLAEQNRGVSESLQRVDAMVSEVMQLRQNESRPGQRRNLTSLINQSTTRRDLQVSRLQPNSRGEIQVRLESAVFDDVLAWLHDLEYREGLLVREVSVTQSGTVGRVNATIRIGQAG